MTRCKNGTRKNKKTGHCEPIKSTNKKMKPISLNSKTASTKKNNMATMTTVYVPLFHHKDKNYNIADVIDVYSSKIGAIHASLEYLIENEYIFTSISLEDVEEINSELDDFKDMIKVGDNISVIGENVKDNKLLVGDILKTYTNTVKELNNICEKFNDSYYGKHGWTIKIEEKIVK